MVRARRADTDQVMLEIIDNGVGFTPYKLSKIQASLADDSGEISYSESGFGLENVHKRIQLYYGKQYGLTVQSKYQEGTRVTVTIPLLVSTEPEKTEEQKA